MNDIDFIVPKPILLNCWKHHKKFIQNEIEKISRLTPESVIEQLKRQLLIIGESQTDLYTGNLSPIQISDSIINLLNINNKLVFNEYKNWVKEDHSDYKTISIEDGSCWTLRIGNNDEYYIHIHPCRNTPYSIRIRSLNLKTAIAVVTWMKLYKIVSYDINIVNKIRREILSECPVKSLEKSTGLYKVIQLLLARD